MRVSGGNNVSDDKGAVPGNAQLLVLDLQAGNDMVFDDAFAGNEMDVAYADSAAETGLLHGIVQSSAKDGKDIHFLSSGREQMLHGSHRGGKHTLVGVKAHHFRKRHQATGSLVTENEITVDKLPGLQFIHICILQQANRMKACLLQTSRHKKSRLESNRDTKLGENLIKNKFL